MTWTVFTADGFKGYTPTNPQIHSVLNGKNDDEALDELERIQNRRIDVSLEFLGEGPEGEFIFAKDENGTILRGMILKSSVL